MSQPRDDKLFSADPIAARLALPVQVAELGRQPAQLRGREMELSRSQQPAAGHQAPPARHDAAVERSRLFLHFVCPDDPSRAFIAEAFVRGLAGGAAEAWAHGDPADVDPAARRVMNDVGMPLREGGVTTSIPRDGSDLVVLIQNRDSPSLSDVMTWHFDDPAESGDEVTKVTAFRRVRDEIKRRVDLLLLVKRKLHPRKGEERQELGARSS
jgi:protein-tyrosine-phosphatase